ncbi:MAG TPA: type 4a pilus biogenesis protein PilO [Candidatus Hydrogenedentes bacterium]|nr:type 4a pilus biogenesis protein PilO [Candidatus Hydrogenedentota bacterium]HNT87268.1 type 4a pilus biogenesis protein PilO [Candidatus Hydrogenedentota bacterium]
MLDFFKGTVTRRDWAFVAAVFVIIVVLAVLFVFLVYNRQQEELARIGGEIGRKSSELAEARRNAENIEALRALERYTDALSEQLRLRLPDEREFLSFLQTLESISADHDLTISFKPGNPKKDAFKETSPYTVTARGAFHKILRFVNDLECYDRYVRVDDIDIKYVAAGVSEAKFVVSTFRFLEPAVEMAAQK